MILLGEGDDLALDMRDGNVRDRSQFAEDQEREQASPQPRPQAQHDGRDHQGGKSDQQKVRMVHRHGAALVSTLDV